LAAVLLALAAPGLASARPATDLSLSPADGFALATSAAELSHDVLVGRTLASARDAARLGGPRVTHRVRRRLSRLDFHGLVHARHALTRQLGVLRAQQRAVAKVKGTLATIRACESGGKYTTNTGNGFYGAYQFDRGTWRSVGGRGVASDAPPLEQDARAAALLARSGSSPWPVCGH
jgi:hypothetical protein